MSYCTAIPGHNYGIPVQCVACPQSDYLISSLIKHGQTRDSVSAPIIKAKTILSTFLLTDRREDHFKNCETIPDLDTCSYYAPARARFAKV